ncbi:MAG: hypothetical protein N2116_07245 [Armatimonadetes bacterium]|nr:hypothetical protein [Armatimonadota bacterium]
MPLCDRRNAARRKLALREVQRFLKGHGIKIFSLQTELETHD